MATVFFSGVDRPAHLELLANEQAAGMINASNATHKALLEAYHQWPHIPLALDSLRQRDIGAYIATIQRVEPFFRWISNLDIIDNQHASNRNYEYLQAHLPPHIRSKILWVLQPGGSMKELEEMASRCQIVGIGGLVPLLRRQGYDDALRYLTQVGEHLMAVRAQAHVFGLASPTLIFRLRAEPWLASIDSSKWLVAYRAAQVLRLTGTGQCRASQLQLCLRPHEMAANNIRVMQIWILPEVPQPLLLPQDAEAEAAAEQQPLYQYFIFLQSDLHLDTYFGAFLATFGTRNTELSSGEEENELFLTVMGPASLGGELDAWCDEALRTGLADCGWQRAEEEFA